MADVGVELSYYWLPFLGFVVGLLATMVGGNGAFFFPPALILLFQVSPRIAITTSLAAVIPIGLIGSIEHYRRQNINLPVGILFGMAGLLGAFGGAWLSNRLSPDTLVMSFGIYAIVLGLFTIRLPGRKTEGTNPPLLRFADMHSRQFLPIILIGLVSGFVAGLYGTSGTAPVLAGLFLLRLPLLQVIGTSVLIVFINAFSGFSGHLLLGEFDWELVFLLGSGAVVGAFIGPRLLGRIKPGGKGHKYRYILSVLLIILGVYLVSQFI